MSKDKDKDKKPIEVDKSTPNPSDQGLFLWIANLFQGNERADKLRVLRLIGRRGESTDPIPIVEHLFSPNEKPTQEKLISVSNELIEAMQNDVNAIHVAMMYEVFAHNTLKGSGAYLSRRIRIEPTRFLAELGHNNGHSDEGEITGLEDHFRKRAIEAWNDSREYTHKAIETLGGIVHVQAEMIRDRDRHIRESKEIEMRERQMRYDAEDRALDREMVRNRAQWDHERSERGWNLLGNLIPQAGAMFGKMANAKPAPISEKSTTSTPESVVETPPAATVETPEPQKTAAMMVIDASIANLSVEERSKVFGDWTKEGVCVNTGVLTGAQVRILMDVLTGRLGAEHLDLLLYGENKITDAQGIQLYSFLNMEKIKPLTDFLSERKAKLEAAQQPTPAA